MPSRYRLDARGPASDEWRAQCEASRQPPPFVLLCEKTPKRFSLGVDHTGPRGVVPVLCN